MGRVYLIAILCGAIGALGLSITAPDRRPWSVGLQGLILAWVTTAGMAYYAIRQRQIQVHQEWMVRSYVVTFAFVTYRFLYDVPPMSAGPGERAVDHRHLGVLGGAAAGDRSILQLRRMHPRGGEERGLNPPQRPIAARAAAGWIMKYRTLPGS